MNINVLLGKTLKDIKRVGDYVLYFTTENNKIYKMYHENDCCENVEIQDIDNDLDVLVGSPILLAEEVTNDQEPTPIGGADSFLWTFYKLGTAKGSVTIRWLGISNGYYSEAVSFCKVDSYD